MKEVVAYRGQLTTLDEFIQRFQDCGEITTQDVLTNASIACFRADKIDMRVHGFLNTRYFSKIR